MPNLEDILGRLVEGLVAPLLHQPSSYCHIAILVDDREKQKYGKSFIKTFLTANSIPFSTSKIGRRQITTTNYCISFCCLDNSDHRNFYSIVTRAVFLLAPKDADLTDVLPLVHVHGMMLHDESARCLIWY